ncbi:hypothetical protein CMQ_3806 [Grosmannia clavigera kw1407]|uniref:Uncharacterized protein n=1 Tax=Grosmannia clavigera (strain kw1407 / UAMH 11150) TaxID=655863 RepID=F0X887_GROCL|nr:uncharacterized protein CMQ_3806 [Grosmannia clavigera kw1407]EFX05737.1 hypothetical protein CMQ_3806 [Grosmannia clavigera kw1407]
MASPRCSARGHYDECEFHHNFYNPREGCVRCKGEVKRAEQQEGAAQRELAESERQAREASEAAKAAAASSRKQASHAVPTQTTRPTRTELSLQPSDTLVCSFCIPDDKPHLTFDTKSRHEEQRRASETAPKTQSGEPTAGHMSPVHSGHTSTMPSQRPFFLSAFFAAFRQQPSSSPLSTSTAAAQQANRHSSTATGSASVDPASVSSAAAAAVAASHRLHATRSHSSTGGSGGGNGSSCSAVSSGVASASGGIPIAAGGAHAAGGQATTSSTSGSNGSYGYYGSDEAYYGVASPHRQSGRRRGSDSSSEGFRDVMGADKWYIGGRTAAGEERFFKLGVVRRVRSGDRLSLDRLSL